MSGEMLTLQVHSIKAHMNENISAVLTVKANGVLRLKKHSNLAIHR